MQRQAAQSILSKSFAIDHRPTFDRLQEINKHERVEKADDERLNNDWEREVAKRNKNKKCRPVLLKFLEEFLDVWAAQTGRT